MSVNIILKCERISQKIKQKFIAEKLGLKESAFSHYENGKRSIPVEVFVKWCRLLNLEIKDFEEIT